MVNTISCPASSVVCCITFSCCLNLSLTLPLMWNQPPYINGLQHHSYPPRLRMFGKFTFWEKETCSGPMHDIRDKIGGAPWDIR